MKLSPHCWGKKTDAEIDAICLRYIRLAFRRFNPICLTHDGIEVEYNFGDYHYFTEENEQTGLPETNRLRAERLHWILPTIRGKVLHNYFRDIERPAKRVYYLKRLEYLVALNYLDDGRLRLISAYKITKDRTRKRMHRDFHLYKKVPVRDS